MKDSNAPQPAEFLTFCLADQHYALDIMSVREIRGGTRPTPLPHAPSYLKGVVNLRGTVLPVISLSERFGLSVAVENRRNVIIVVEQGEQLTGLLVDEVSDIVSCAPDAMQPPPDIAQAGNKGVIRALTVINGKMVRILDLAETVNSTQKGASV